MKTNSQPRRFSILGLGVALMLAASAVPSLGHASDPIPADPCPTKSLIELRVDPVTGGIQMRDDAGGWESVGDVIVVEVGNVDNVDLHLLFAGHEWEVEVTADSEPSETVFTFNSELEYEMDTSFTDYNFHATDVGDASVNMDFLIRLDTACL
jgi:hypothetical protein